MQIQRLLIAISLVLSMSIAVGLDAAGRLEALRSRETERIRQQRNQEALARRNDPNRRVIETSAFRTYHKPVARHGLLPAAVLSGEGVAEGGRVVAGPVAAAPSAAVLATAGADEPRQQDIESNPEINPDYEELLSDI